MRVIHRLGVLTAMLLAFTGAASAAQGQDQAFLRGLSFEGEERWHDAASAYREALRDSPGSVPALLGLERVYATIGWTDSIFPYIDRAIVAAPRMSAIRAAQIRSYRFTGRPDRAHEAFERWVRDVPRDPAPYREYARLLLQDNQTVSADSVLQRAQAALGRQDELEIELAQLRAAMGMWVLSASSWRRAVRAVPHYEQAAVFSLAPTPPEKRDSVRALLVEDGNRVPQLRVAAALELLWGSAEAGWRLLAPLRADSAAVRAWLDYADRAEEVRAWLSVRDALVAVTNVDPAPELLIRAAAAAYAGGDPTSAAHLARRAMAGGAGATRDALPTLIRALGAMGRAAEAERLYVEHAPSLPPEMREDLTRHLAWAWARAGNTIRAREFVAGSDAPPEVAGWLALYEGDLAAARTELTRGNVESSAQLVIAIALLTRTGAERSAASGHAFLALARGDSAQAAADFERAARELPDAASLLLLHSARLSAAREPARAAGLWRRIAEEHQAAPEAPEALLEWARALRRAGDRTGAAERLEQLILTYPRSALVPQARRELEQMRVSMRPAP